METITSRQNPKVQQIRALARRKERESQGLFVVEGIRHVGEAVEAGARLEYLLYAPDLLTSPYAQGLLAALQERDLPCYPAGADVFSYLSDKDNPAGLLAVAHRLDLPLSALSPDNLGWAAALISPQDPGNLGAILRTLDAVGAQGLLLLDEGVDPYHPTAVRASMGTLFWHSIARASFADFSTWAKKHAYHLYGSSAQGGRDYRQIERYAHPAILLLGGERQGLTGEQADICEFVVRLPMHGRATSLNLAVAAGLLLYDMHAKLPHN